MLLGKLVEVFAYHCPHKCFEARFVTSVYLQQQTFLQCACADARRVKLLQYRRHPVYLLGADVQPVVYSQLVGNGVGALAQQSVVVERSDQIFHYLGLPFGQLCLAHLLFQPVVERYSITVYDLFTLFVGGHPASVVYRQVLVIASYSAQRLVECCLPVFTFLACGEVFVGSRSVFIGSIVFVNHVFVVVVRVCFESRVVVHLGAYAFEKLVQWQFHELRLQQLLLRDGLQLFECLLLSCLLNLTLCH